MPDLLGNIEIPEAPVSSDPFPLISDYGYGRAHAPQIVEHLIANATGANLKISQRFYVGNGLRQFTVRLASMSEDERNALRVFWENRSGPWEGFPYLCPTEDGSDTETLIVRFENAPLSWEFAAQVISSTGLTLIEIPDDAAAPVYELNGTQTRFPSTLLESALLAQVQRLIPLIKITTTDPDYPVMYVSDRRCTVGGQLYLARLLNWDGIQQGIGGEADDASFVLGNADRVMTALANDVDLFRASIEFSLFHVGTGIKLDLWKGDVADWDFDAGSEFRLRAVDGLYELNLPYPTRRISRTCWKDFNDGNSCPAATNGGSSLDTPCDKGFDTPAGCQFHAMDNFFGGIVAKPQAVRTKDNSSGSFGFGRSPLTTSSQIADSIYDEVVPEVYTDVPFPVNGKIVSGRDEGDFYTALAILSEGPIGNPETPYQTMDPGFDQDGNPRIHQLDGQAHHGPGNLGLRRGYGEDPARTFNPDPNSDKFSLGEGGSGIQTYGAEKAAGTAFIEIRRSDPKGLQLSRLSEHQLQAYISAGLGGWVWLDAESSGGTFTREFRAPLTNPVWLVINIMLRARGYRRGQYIPSEHLDAAEQLFDIAAAIDAAAICDLEATPIIPGHVKVWVSDSSEDPSIGHYEDQPTTEETQFKFIGILQQEKPLRDWATEILMNCSGYYTFAFGKLKIGIRVNSSAVEAFTEGNILAGSLKLAPIKPSYNHLTANFADGEFDFVNNSVTVYDIDHAKRIGGATSPLFLKSTLNLSGTPSKSQAARLIATRLREELGGIYRTNLSSSTSQRSDLEFLAAREISFKTTVLALNVEPGMVCSMTHEDMPTYQEANDTINAPQPETPHYGEFRVTGWRLNSDYSIDIEGRTTHNDMYDLEVGPKPADVEADPIPIEQEFAPADINFTVLTKRDGILRLRDFTCATNAATVHLGFFEIYYIPEASNSYARMVGDVSDAFETTVHYEGEAPIAGEWILLESEIMFVVSVNPEDFNSGTCEVLRGQLGTTAVAHHRISTSINLSEVVGPADFTVEPSLLLRPGNRLFTDPGAEQQPIAEYIPASGVLRTILPFEASDFAGDVYSDPRIFRVSLRTEVIEFQPRFFKSAKRARFEHLVDMPFAGVVAVSAVLENTRGFRSLPVIKRFTSTFPYRLRTLGTTSFSFVHQAVPTGINSDLFESIQAAKGQSFESAYAEIVSSGEAGDRIQIPSSVSAISPAYLVAGGTITIAGIIDATGAIHITIGDPATDKLYVGVPVFWITTETTAAEVASSLADWLNAYDEFAAFFFASAAGPVISITDLSSLGGAIATEVAGAVTAAPVGLASQLGIMTGRRYAVSFKGGGYQSDLSPLSASTGPTGGASRIEIKDIPIPTDERMTEVQIYAPPDGEDSPLYLVAEVAAGDTFATDEILESDLTDQAAYPGATGPELSGAGEVTVTVKADGAPWFEVRIPTTQARSNVIDGLALGNITPGTLLTADVNNDSGRLAELKVVIQ